MTVKPAADPSATVTMPITTLRNTANDSPPAFSRSADNNPMHSSVSSPPRNRDSTHTSEYIAIASAAGASRNQRPARKRQAPGDVAENRNSVSSPAKRVASLPPENHWNRRSAFPLMA